LNNHHASSVNVVDIIVKIDSRFALSKKLEYLLGNAAKAKIKLVCVPQITLEQICVKIMTNHLGSSERHYLLKQNGRGVSSRFGRIACESNNICCRPQWHGGFSHN
jgi:hypothetical protein